MAYSDKTRSTFSSEIDTIREKGLYKEKRFICSPQDAEILVEFPEGAPEEEGSELLRQQLPRALQPPRRGRRRPQGPR